MDFPWQVFHAMYKSSLHPQAYPDALVPSFKPTVTELFEGCMKLALKILEAMGYALKLQVYM